MKKKLMTLVLVAIMFTLLAIPAAAQTGAEVLEAALNDLEGRLAGNANAAAAISQARTQLADPEFRASISVAQATEKVAHKDAALATLGDAAYLSDLSAEEVARIMSHVESAAAVSGWTASLDTTNMIVSIRAADDAPIVTAPAGRGVIRQTGIDASRLIVVIVALTALFGAAMLVAVRTRAGKKVETPTTGRHL